MSLSQVHATHGTTALLKLLGAIVGFLLLQLVRLPLVLLVRVLDAAVRRMDTIAQPSTPPRRAPSDRARTQPV